MALTDTARRTCARATLAARYAGAVDITEELITAVLARVDGQDPGVYVAQRVADAVTEALAEGEATAARAAEKRAAEDAGPWNGFDMNGTRVAAYADRYRAENALERRQVAAISPAPRPASPAPPAHAAALAGECSHGGHGWDGDTCSDIEAGARAMAAHAATAPPPPAEAGTCGYCGHAQPLAQLEHISPFTSTLACRDLDRCQARVDGEAEAAADDDMFGPQGDDTTSDLAYEHVVETR